MTRSLFRASIGLPAIEEGEAELQFAADTLVAWEEYELTGVHVSSEEIEAKFDCARTKAGMTAKD